MNVDQDHVIHLKNGRLKTAGNSATTTRADVDRIVGAALAKGTAPHLVVHFHGGLVNEKAGRAIAKALAPLYSEAGAYPVFIVWEAGLLESIRNNLEDIRRDPLFRQLVKKVSIWVLKQLPSAAGFKGAGSQVDADRLEGEYDEWFAGKRSTLPEAMHGKTNVAIFKSGAVAEPIESDLQQKIQMELGPDAEFQQVIAAVAQSVTPQSLANPVPKATGVGVLVSPLTEASPQQIDQAVDVKAGKGFVSMAKIALLIARITIAVIRRFLHERAHGLYTTIIEETLGALYLDKVGGTIWNQMKKDTKDAFGAAPECGGSALLDAIASSQTTAGKAFSRVTLVGHSTGAIYICNLLDKAAQVMPHITFEVVFLAPAATHRRAAAALKAHAARIAKFRMFGMHDELESADRLVPIVYTRSLLYFVSGVLEFEGVERTVDEPVLGMERFVTNPTFDDPSFPDVATVRQFLGLGAHTPIWSKTATGAPAGSSSESAKHGDFDNDPLTLSSLSHILKNGF